MKNVKEKFGSEPLFDSKYLKTKIKFYDNKIATNVYCKVHQERLERNGSSMFCSSLGQTL